MAAPKNYLVDMDGVLIRGRTVIPGAQEFVQRLKAREAKFLVLTGVTRREDLDRWPYQPTLVVESVAHIEV